MERIFFPTAHQEPGGGEPEKAEAVSSSKELGPSFEFATNNDLPEIARFYSTRRHLALQEKDPGKPVFNNQCSKQHPLANSTLIHRSRIILGKAPPAILELGHFKPAKPKHAKFQALKTSRVIYDKMKAKDRQPD